MLALRDVWYKDIIRGVTLEIGKGITAIIGPNGAGKTTLLRIMAGVIKPDKGIVERRGRVAASWQNPYYGFYKTSVRDEVKYALKLIGKPADNVDKILMDAGLLEYADMSPFKLSMGQARVLSITLALLTDPDILLIDEPTTGLDAYEKRRLVDVLKGVGRPIVIASHDIDFVIEVADHVAVMDRGRIIAYGDTLDIFYESDSLEKIGFPRPFIVSVGKAIGLRLRSVDELAEIIK